MTMMCKEKLLDAVQGKELFSKRLKNKKFSFTSVVIDSNDVVAGSLFVPLLGQFQDGHIYVEAAVLKGATVVLVCSSSIEEFFSTYEKLNSLEVCIIAVENTLYALQALAAAYVREFPNLIKIAITGSSGKTTTKELIASVLKQKYNLVMTEGNLNSETGLPLSVLNIRKEHEVGVFEIGMNRTDEIAELTDVLFPHIAVITNVGTSHIGILGTKDEIAQQKKQIFKNFSNDSVAFIPEHDDYASFLAENVRGKIIYYGKRQTEGVSNPRFLGIRGTEFVIDNKKTFLILPGMYNFYNALAAISVAKYMGLDTAEIVLGIEKNKPLFGRSQIINGHCTIVQDCYNANFESMSEAIELCDKTDVKGKKIFILGDMLELGDNSSNVHRQVCERALQSSADYIVFVGKEICKAYKHSKKTTKRVYCIENISDESIQKSKGYLERVIAKDDFVLLKASRGIRLERFIPLLPCVCKENGGIDV